MTVVVANGANPFRTRFGGADEAADGTLNLSGCRAFHPDGVCAQLWLVPTGIECHQYARPQAFGYGG